MFYTYRQNNSGGSFYGPHFVIVEADDPRFANVIAEDHGLYFNGVEHGRDCECCGDRWSAQWAEDKGDPEPMIYDKRVEEYVHWWPNSTVKIVYKNGTVKELDLKNE